MQFKAPLVAALFSSLAVATSTGAAEMSSASEPMMTSTTVAPSAVGPAVHGSSMTAAPSARMSGLALASALASQLPSSVRKQLSSASGSAEFLSIVTPYETSSAFISSLPSTLQSEVAAEATGGSGSGSGSDSSASASSSTSAGGAAATGVGMSLAGAAGIMGVAFAL